MLGETNKLIVLCLILLSRTNFLVMSKVNAVMKPVNPSFEEGTTLVLNCTINGTIEEIDDEINSSMVIVRSKEVIYTAPRYMFPLDDRTVQFRLENVTFEDRGRFICGLVVGNIKFHEASQDVHIFRRPLKPQMVNCTLKQFKLFECFWTPSLTYQINYTNINKLSQELQVSFPSNQRTLNCSSFQYNCSVNLTKNQIDPLEMIKRQVCAKVILKSNITPYFEAHSDVRCWNLSDTIYPESPKFVEMIESSEGCLLKWEQPFQELYKSIPLNYYLTLVPNYNESEKFFLKAKETSYTFSPCQPYTRYSARISSESVAGGYPSEISCFTFETSPTVPCQPVETSPYLLFNDNSKNKMLIYWKPLQRKDFCGSDFHYVLLKKLLYDDLRSNGIGSTVTGRDGTEWMAVKAVNTSFVQQETYSLCPAGDCLFAVAPKNNEGYLLDNMINFKLPNTEKVSDVASVTIDKLICEIHRGSVILNWNTLDRRNLSSTWNITIGVYTCRSLSHSYICHNEMQLKATESNVGHYNLLVDSDVAAELSYGVAVFVSGFSSEIFWCNKFYDLYGPIPHISQIFVERDENQMDVMQVHWLFRQEDCSNCSYVLYFAIFYCQTEDEKTCDSNETKISVPNDVRTIEIKNLKKYSSYLVRMASASRVSMSNFTTTLVLKPSMNVTYIVLLCLLVVALTVIPVLCIFKCFSKCKKSRETISRGRILLPPIDTPNYTVEFEKSYEAIPSEIPDPILVASEDEEDNSAAYTRSYSQGKSAFSAQPLSSYSQIRPATPMNSFGSAEYNRMGTNQNPTLLTQQDLNSECNSASQRSNQPPNVINYDPSVSNDYVPLETICFSETQD